MGLACLPSIKSSPRFIGIFKGFLESSLAMPFWIRIIVLLGLIAMGNTLSHAAPITTIMVIGDSLTAGYGLAKADGFTRQLEVAMQREAPAIKIINAGVSGDTSRGGKARLDWLLSDKPDMVILQLGANDGLRGLPPQQTRFNIDAMLTQLKEQQIPVLLAGMLAPPNLGKVYGLEFNRLYHELAEKHGVVLFPFFLQDVAAEISLNQADGIHPNKEGVAIIVKNILPYIMAVIEQHSP